MLEERLGRSVKIDVLAKGALKWKSNRGRECWRLDEIESVRLIQDHCYFGISMDDSSYAAAADRWMRWANGASVRALRSLVSGPVTGRLRGVGSSAEVGYGP